MSDETKVPPEDMGSTETTGAQGQPGTGTGTGSSWREVGDQFKTLGESLAQAVRASWENEETQKTVQEMRSGLETMVREVGKAMDEGMNSPQGQRIRRDAERAGESLRNAGEQTVKEVRPQLIQALEQVNSELQKMINRMESRTPHGGSAAADQPAAAEQPPYGEDRPTEPGDLPPT